MGKKKRKPRPGKLFETHVLHDIIGGNLQKDVDWDKLPKFITMNQAAKILGVVHTTVYHWLASDRLNGRQMDNGQWRILKTKVREIYEKTVDSYIRTVFVVDSNENAMQWMQGEFEGEQIRFHQVGLLKEFLVALNDVQPALIIINYSCLFKQICG